jgi:hypothetical protein
MDLTFHPRFDCAICPTRCDGRSKSAYAFEDGVPLFIIWRVKRPCLGEGYWDQHIGPLIAIGNRYRDHRTWRRASTDSDYVDGEHKGVVVNYHFSLRELRPLEELLLQMAEL